MVVVGEGEGGCELPGAKASGVYEFRHLVFCDSFPTTYRTCERDEIRAASERQKQLESWELCRMPTQLENGFFFRLSQAQSQRPQNP